jgi:hypothetical protein
MQLIAQRSYKPHALAPVVHRVEVFGKANAVVLEYEREHAVMRPGAPNPDDRRQARRMRIFCGIGE